MKRINYIFLFLLAICAGCYEDKGNYDYKDIQSIEIEKFDGISKTIGDTIRIEPVFNIDIPEDASYISYEWSIDGKTRPDDPNWNSRNFYWIADEIVSSHNFALKITDERYGVKYMQHTSCFITGEFDARYSWIILSEENGKAMLSFFKAGEMEYSDDNVGYIIDWKEYKDLYSSRNDGQELGRGALSMQEHYNGYSNNDAGNIWIFTESGAVDLEGVGLTKDIDLNETFMGGVPAGVIIQGGVFMQQVDVLYDQEGHLYSRIKSDNNLFNSDYFLSEPIKYKGEILEQCETVLERYTKDKGAYTLIVDRKNSRLLAIVDGGDDYLNPMKGAAEVIAVPEGVVLQEGEELPENYIPLNNFEGYEVFAIQYRLFADPNNTWNTKPGFSILFKNAAGQMYLEEFVLQCYDDVIEGGSYLEISEVKVYDMNNLLGKEPSLMCTPPYAVNNYSFFAVGNVLYLLDKDSGISKKYVEFDAPITALDADNRENNMYVAVGLENGEFHVVNIINAKNRPEDTRIICSSKKRFGKIIQINWKVGNGWSSWT